MDADELKKYKGSIEAICTLAAANFPRETDIVISVISVDGNTNGRMRVPYYILLKLIGSRRDP